MNATDPMLGKMIPVDLEKLVEQIYVFPSSPAFFSDLVQKVLNRYGLKREVQQSAMDAKPLY